MNSKASNCVEETFVAEPSIVSPPVGVIVMVPVPLFLTRQTRPSFESAIAGKVRAKSPAPVVTMVSSVSANESADVIPRKVRRFMNSQFEANFHVVPFENARCEPGVVPPS